MVDGVGLSVDHMLQSTLQGLEAGLHVQLIATFPFKGCDISDDAQETIHKFRTLDIDTIPVMSDGVTVGVFECASGTQSRKRVGERMKSLDGSMLVSGNEPLERFLPLMRESRYRLVVSGGEIQGIVTRSDLLKLPVRLYAFCLIAHLEHTMGRIIAEQFASWSEWEALLCATRAQCLRKKERQLRKSGMNPDMVEMTYLKEKVQILASLNKFGDSFDEILCLNPLRNDIAHGKNFAHDYAGLLTFLDQLDLARKWLGTFHRHLESLPEGG